MDRSMVVAVAASLLFSFENEKKRPQSSVFFGEPRNIITNDLNEMQQNNSKWQRACRFFTVKLHRFFFKSESQVDNIVMHRSIFGV